MRLGQQTVSSLERCPRVLFIARFLCSAQFTFRLDTTTPHRMVFIAHALFRWLTRDMVFALW